MKTPELVKKLLEAGANADAVAIAIQAVEEATPRRRRKPRAVIAGRK
ncbi:MAG TPA: hypothetical protein VIH81_13425 [Roseiarcus sp.]